MARGCVPGRGDVDLGGPLVELVLQDRGVGEDQRVRRHGAVVLLAAERSRGVVDRLAVDVLLEHRHLELVGQRDDVVLGRPDERATGLDHGAGAEAVVEHPAADAVTGLDDEHRAAGARHLASGHEAGDAGADHDDVDVLRQRAAGGGCLGSSVENSRGEYADARQRQRRPSGCVWSSVMPPQRANPRSATQGPRRCPRPGLPTSMRLSTDWAGNLTTSGRLGVHLRPPYLGSGGRSMSGASSRRRAVQAARAARSGHDGHSGLASSTRGRCSLRSAGKQIPQASQIVSAMVITLSTPVHCEK